MTDAPELRELEALYSCLTPNERDELLQEMLVGAANGPEAVTAVLRGDGQSRKNCKMLGSHVLEVSPAVGKGTQRRMGILRVICEPGAHHDRTVWRRCTAGHGTVPGSDAGDH